MRQKVSASELAASPKHQENRKEFSRKKKKAATIFISLSLKAFLHLKLFWLILDLEITTLKWMCSLHINSLSAGISEDQKLLDYTSTTSQVRWEY